ncbi:MAG: helix-turn-helix domain-containing protein [Legionellales bacterium]|nr:helix-turn-helix domain-containing protein [Legionellales bacterium]
MSKRNIEQELLESICTIKQGKGKKREIKLDDIRHIRDQLSLSQTAFAALLGVSERTLQDWEQGRRHPSGAARSLLYIASKHPEVFVDRVWK